MLFFCVCKALLPVTALAAGNDRPYSLYVGNTDVAKTEYSDNAAYWTSSDGGTNWTSQLDKPTADSYIHYDGNGTLTLHNVNISSSNENGIYAEAMSGSAVSLSIVLEGKNNVSGASGIYVFSKLGDASLSISGTGSLTAEGTGGGSFSGIQVQSNNGKAELTINNVDVTATNNVAQGIILRSAGSSTASLTVNGGKLTASGSDAGIKYVFGSSATGDGTPTVTVSGNAIVRANGGISDDSSTDIQIGADSNESNGGIVWNGKDGTVYGDVTLQEDLEIGEGESLTLDDNASLNAGNHNVIVDGGTLDENLANSLGDSVKYAPNIVTTSLSNGTVGTAYSQTLTATGDTPITWSVTGGSLPAGLSLDENTGVISGIPNAAGTYNFTVTATNDAGRDSREYTLKINAVPVTSVTLDKSKLSLYIGNTETLNVTVKPNNATNKNVTWSSSNEKVAVVDESGKVTAKAPGTAVITVKTVDGSKTATCEVTVVRKNSGIIIPPTTNGNWRQTPIGWWYQNPDGTYPANQWRYLDSGKGYKAWYWFNQYGYMTTGWQKVGNTWYYMNRSGEMQTGWVFVNSQWYYLNSSGAMLTGWVYDGGKWYYMNKDGSMHFGWLSWAGYWYHLDSHGAMSTGWKQVNGKWYYLYAQNGRMAANTTTPDGYRVGADGAWIR